LCLVTAGIVAVNPALAANWNDSKGPRWMRDAGSAGPARPGRTTVRKVRVASALVALGGVGLSVASILEI
jgi:hypothetical protein